jgi:hypothetical protein
MTDVLTPEFVEYIPETLDDGKIYISTTYGTAVHKCCCGCGREVVTPLSANGWRLTVDGAFISLYPSIGNWSFPCQSHYWIRRNEIRWTRKWSRREIATGRRFAAKANERYFDEESASIESDEATNAATRNREASKTSLWQQVKRLFFG